MTPPLDTPETPGQTAPVHAVQKAHLGTGRSVPAAKVMTLLAAGQSLYNELAVTTVLLTRKGFWGMEWTNRRKISKIVF